ncbi:MAG: tRNA (adenosine(37)-N6)-threonylcarbamoyltransferase complex transferase subunit TsaD [Cytophagales bacterium]|nr:MAG: tRNA (adenosine(37)-N6)-threonylcarbamoyltransferase complex transferase subunit TsaD [Cytophagales bacterium]TAF61373.1 MAG: tRNA (adenosine(37)-N6)-threonylcarbamoyltransferase complex transferase subunit TsaD [Cytophagales bacterium]
MIILAIESSCDETSAAIMRDGVLLSHLVATQTIHEQYGGVVPELASRAHEQNIVPVVQETLKKANLQFSDLQAVAFTQGPGLLGALLVGASYAKSLAWALNVPLIAVNHLKAHVLAHFIEKPSPSFPFLCLTVSGGHTQILLVQSPINMQILGQTQDDAVGEAFDKAAKLLGLPYPGGRWIDHYAQTGNALAYSFPTSQLKDLDFSFSGMKTSFLYFLQKHLTTQPDFITQNLNDICASYQQALINVLLTKLKLAVAQTGIKEVALAGGVSANSALRKQLQALGEHEGWQTYIPKFEYCTDNAAMIAMTAHFMAQENVLADLEVQALPRLPF